jgi:hypothetical protein
MKIIEFDADPAKTNTKQVAYVTDPPLTEEVFRQFSQRLRNDPGINIEFFLEGGLLVVRRVDLDGRDLDEVEKLLTEAERQVQRAHDSAKKEHEEFLQQLSNMTGRGVRTKPPVAEAGGSAGNSDKK